MSVETGRILRQAFQRRKKENPSFSMQVMATKLKVSLSLVSQILSGKRSLRPDLAEAFCRLLDLDRVKRDLVLREILKGKRVERAWPLVPEPKARRPRREVQWQMPPRSQFSALEQWFYLAILDVTLLKDYDGSVEFVARRLELPVPLVRQAVKDLTAAGLISLASGQPRKAGQFNHFQSASSKEQIRAYHRASLKKADEMLAGRTSESDVEKRLITGVTLTASTEKIAWAQQEIARFVNELAETLAQDEPEEVYQLSLQFFPLTHKQQK